MDRKKAFEDMAKSRTIPFVGKLDGELYSLVRDSLLVFVVASKEPITILFDSKRGGSAFLSFQLGDLIKTLSCKVIGIVLEADSVACTVLQFCEERRICKGGILMVHRARVDGDNGNFSFRDDELFEKKVAEMLCTTKQCDALTLSLLMERTGFPEEEVKKWIQEGEDCCHAIFPEKALSRKLADSIVADFKLFS